jgi:hypothetical protein
MNNLAPIDWIVEICIALYTFGLVVGLIVGVGFFVVATMERILWPEKESTLFLKLLIWNETLASKNVSDYQAIFREKKLSASEEIDYLPRDQSLIRGE